MKVTLLSVFFSVEDATRVPYSSRVSFQDQRWSSKTSGRPSLPDGWYGPKSEEEAQSKRGVLTLKFPIQRGIVTNWD